MVALAFTALVFKKARCAPPLEGAWRRPRAARTLPDRAFRRCKYAGRVRPGSHQSFSPLLAGNDETQPLLAATAGWSMAASRAGREASSEGPCPRRLLPQSDGVGRFPSSGLKASRAPLVVAGSSSAGLDSSLRPHEPAEALAFPPPREGRRFRAGRSAFDRREPAARGSLPFAMDRQPHYAAGPTSAGPTLQPRVPAPFLPRRNA